MAWVGGGMGCSCCCKRNPSVIHYEGIWVGHVDHPVFCLNACANRKDSLGYMSCIDNNKRKFGCSALNNMSCLDLDKRREGRACSGLNNSELAAKVDDYRISYPIIYPGIDTKKMRELDAH